MVYTQMRFQRDEYQVTFKNRINFENDIIHNPYFINLSSR